MSIEFSRNLLKSSILSNFALKLKTSVSNVKNPLTSMRSAGEIQVISYGLSFPSSKVWSQT